MRLLHHYIVAVAITAMTGITSVSAETAYGVGDFANPAIEGEWEFTLDGHYLGEESLGTFTETFLATLNGNTVTFESTKSAYDMVADFTNENILQFRQVAVGAPAIFTLTQSPYVNVSGINNLDELTLEEFNATFDDINGTITFPEGSGLRYGVFTKDGELYEWYDAFDFVGCAVRPGSSSSIKEAAVSGTTETVVYHDIRGRRVYNPRKGFYIRVNGGKAEKVIVEK